MIVVGLIADTHGLYRPEIARAFTGVTMILHAGDVGALSVLEALRKIAPVEAVFGNVDDPRDPALLGERVVAIGGLTIHVSHGHELGRPTPERVLSRYSGDVVVFGHTHRAAVARDLAGRIAVNPGAAGPRRFQVEPSVGRLTVDVDARGKRRAEVEIISLA
jgi:putative phosphoesterase